MKFTPITLEGNFVRLEPLCIHHKQGLCDAIRDGELWNLFVTIVPHPDAIDAFFANAQITLENDEGILRNHMIMPDGRVRDSLIYSIINSEWARVKQHLSFKLTHQY